MATDQAGPTPAVLEVRDVRVTVNGVRALGGVSFDVPEGSLFGLIGPNGAGKTTIMNVISAVITPQHGSVRFRGRELTGTSTVARVRSGILRSFQQVRLLEDLTVLDNLLLGRERFRTVGLLRQIGGSRTGRRQARRDLEAAQEVAAVLGLSDLLHRDVQDLPFGARRLVDVGRAFAAEPDLLLLDEPAAGLDVTSRRLLLDAIKQAQRTTGATVMLVEHDVDLVRRACEEAVVLSNGEVLARGTPTEVLADPAVLRAYFGRNDA
ncbi:ABC transporter ATP-binding protein [Nonomuraea sp. CA-218870]|uniref:ABC transporter ATP-binding protein n=1 Tax=Nonomuraea sp. CA-218870 TaxID=3239998 RepID=UPI003D930670